MTSNNDSERSTKCLIDTAASLLKLLQHFRESGNEPTRVSPVADSPDPLELLQSSAKLLKAQTTKLSLLVINKPYTPSAIQTVLVDILNKCVPAMMSAVQLCHPDQFGRFMRHEVAYRVRRVLKELEGMTGEVLRQAENSMEEPKDESQPEAATHRDSLASTGVVWEACDAIVQLKDVGIVGLVITRAEQYRDMLDDAISELKEWREEEHDEGFEDEEDAIEISDGEDSIERLLTGAQKLPHDREDIKLSLERSLKTLRLTSSLYQAVIKRRLKTFVTSQEHLQQLDSLLKALKQIPHMTDELASMFYELDNDAARSLLAEIVSRGKDIIRLTKLDWQGKEDQYTVWSTKCAEMLEPADRAHEADK